MRGLVGGWGGPQYSGYAVDVISSPRFAYTCLQLWVLFIGKTTAITSTVSMFMNQQVPRKLPLLLIGLYSFAYSFRSITISLWQRQQWPSQYTRVSMTSWQPWQGTLLAQIICFVHVITRISEHVTDFCAKIIIAVLTRCNSRQSVHCLDKAITVKPNLFRN